MPGATGNLALPFPDPTDPIPDYPALAEDLAELLEDEIELVGFRAWANASQALASNTWTKIAFSQEVYDTHGWYDPAAYRFTPLRRGKYLVGARIFADNALNSGQVVQLAIYKNGVEVDRIAWAWNLAGMAYPAELKGHAIVDLDGVDDYVEIFAVQNDSVSRTIHSTRNVIQENRFEAFRIGD